VLALVAVLGIAGATWAQDKKKDAQLRTVRGAVVDKDENPVAEAVVHLKNLKTQSIKTHIAGEKGEFRFSGLDPNIDYEIHAEYQELASARRGLSSFDSRKEIVVHLKLDRKR
jgi:hypothetical protein